jgi:anti-sigma factor RsiW
VACTHDRAALVAFHFGELTLDERDELEARLAGCADCLRELFALKRAIETGEDGPRPSDVVRQRLRRAVARAVAAPAPRRWWHRPVAAAFAIAVVLASMAATNAMTAGPGAAPYAVTDPGPAGG